MVRANRGEVRAGLGLLQGAVEDLEASLRLLPADSQFRGALTRLLEEVPARLSGG